jgi:hypothetical protein
MKVRRTEPRTQRVFERAAPKGKAKRGRKKT